MNANDRSISLNLVVALPAEARPLVDRFKLKRLAVRHPYTIYLDDSTALIVTGIGKLSSAMAVSYLAGLSASLAQPRSPSVWLNVGIAGHATESIGSRYLAHTIYDEESAESWHPTFAFHVKQPLARVHTVGHPVEDYLDEATLYDMEAAGFYRAARRLTTRELIHCYKIVSDNREHAASQLMRDPKRETRVAALIVDALDEIQEFARKCVACARSEM